jgi:hypothetical protein
VLVSCAMRGILLLGFLVALGCAGRATSVAEVGGASSASGSGAGGDSAGAAAGGASAGTSDAGGAPCEFHCPSPFLELQLAVMSSAGIGEVSGVQATLSGPVTVPLNCGGFAGTTYCSPTEGGPAGSYSLEVTAPGFGPQTVNATVTFTPAQRCGCASASLDPSLVTLNPTRL